MYVRPRPRFRPRNAGGVAFSPLSLFTSGVAGAWYDPSDYSTLFQDSAGTTPVTAVEQPVGLMLDKSQGLVLGSELVTNGDFSSGTGWSTGGVWVISGGAASITSSITSLSQSTLAAVVGTWYQVTFTISAFTTGGVRVEFGGVNGASRTAAGTYTQYILATSTSFLVISPIASSTLSIDNVSIKVIAGNHATQATAASRPVLRARYNLLTYSEQFDNAAWTKTGLLAFGSGSVVNATTAPDGTTTADLITENTAPTTNHQLLFNGISFTAGVTTISVYAKAATGTRFFQIYPPFALSGTAGGKFDLQNGTATSVAGTSGCVASISSAGNGWYKCSITLTLTAGSGGVFFNLATSLSASLNDAYSGDGTSGIYIWGADLRTGSSAGTYQRIAAATDYATAGFLPYLYFVTDDSFGTNSIDFTATDKMSVCAGITKLSDATVGIIAELSVSADTNNGAFYIGAPVPGGSANYAAVVRGNTTNNGYALTTFAAPITNTLAVVFNIAGTTTATEIPTSNVNGAVPTRSPIGGGADSGTGNFGNYPLYIGRRNNSLYPFTGNLYQLIVVGKAVSASELASTEAYVNSKTGAY